MFKVRFRLSGLSVVLALLAAILLGSASTAQAGYTYTIFDDGVGVTGSIGVTPGGNSFTTASLTTTHFSLTIASSTTNPQTSATSLQTQLQATLNSTGTHTISIQLSYSGYTLPVGSPLSASSSPSTTFTNSTTSDHSSFQAWGTGGSSSTFQNGTTGGAQTANSGGGLTSSPSMSPTTATFSFTNPGTFSLSQTLSITLGNGNVDGGEVQGTTTVTPPAAVPEPSTIMLALSGAPLLLLGRRFFRRQVA